jgi:hypothetical protein
VCDNPNQAAHYHTLGPKLWPNRSLYALKYTFLWSPSKQLIVRTKETGKPIFFIIGHLYVSQVGPWQIIQGYSKRNINFQKFILQVLFNIWPRAIYRLKGELSKLFSHLTSTRCEPHVWRGRCKIDNPALPTLRITPLGRQICCVCTWHLAEIQIKTLRDFLSIRTQDMDLASVVFVKYFLKCILLF